MKLNIFDALIIRSQTARAFEEERCPAPGGLSNSPNIGLIEKFDADFFLAF